jgi:hypothetical protein
MAINPSLRRSRASTPTAFNTMRKARWTWAKRQGSSTVGADAAFAVIGRGVIGAAIVGTVVLDHAGGLDQGDGSGVNRRPINVVPRNIVERPVAQGQILST